MTYSASDMSDDVCNRLVALGLIQPPSDDDDPQLLGIRAVSAITMMSKTIVMFTGVLDVLLKNLPDNAAEQLSLAGLAMPQISQTWRGKIERFRSLESLRETVHGPAARFMRELLDAHECLTDVVDQYNAHTLADLFYLYSAIHKDTYIEVFNPTDSRVIEVVRQLPSAEYWSEFIRIVDDAKSVAA